MMLCVMVTIKYVNFWTLQDYTPYSCQKIISSAPGVGDHHGCRIEISGNYSYKNFHYASG